MLIFNDCFRWRYVTPPERKCKSNSTDGSQDRFSPDRRNRARRNLSSGFDHSCVTTWAFPGGASGKEPAWRCRCWFDVGKIPLRRTWQPTPVFLPGESQGQRSLAGSQSWTRLKWLSTALPILKADKNKATLFKVRIRSWELYPINTSLPPSSFHIDLLRESLHPEIATKTVEMSVWEMQMGPDGEEVEY